MMEGPGADSEEKHEPVSDIDTAVVVVGLKALDPEWPIREAIGEQRTWLDLLLVRSRSRMTRSGPKAYVQLAIGASRPRPTCGNVGEGVPVSDHIGNGDVVCYLIIAVVGVWI